MDIIHPDDRLLFDTFLAETLKTQTERQTAEFRLLHACGDWRVFETISQNLLNDTAVAGIVLNARDISIRKQVEEALKHSEEHLITLMSQVLQAQEKERKRLSSELHDVVGQNLLFLKFKIALLERGLLTEQKDQQNICEEILSYVDQIVEDVRRLCWDLVPSALEDLGLTAAITSLLEDFASHYEIEIEVNFERIDDSLTQKEQILIYRLFQEALTNIGKHAKASRVVIEVCRSNARIHFRIADNGLGFATVAGLSRDKGSRGMGLSTMQERARILGADFKVSSAPGEGASILFSIPTDQED